MMPAAEFIHSGGLEHFHRNHALRFFLTVEQLMKAGGEASELVTMSTALERVASRSAGDLVKHGSSFFWYHLDRLYLLVEDGDPVPEHAVSMFLAHLFDSFHPTLEETDAVRLAGLESDEHVVLPCLGLRLPAKADHLTLSKLTGDRIGIKDGPEIGTRSPGQYTLPSVQVTPTAQVLFEVDALIGDTIASQRLADLSNEERRMFGQMLSDSLDMIRTVDHELSARLESLVRWYFPIQTPDKRRVHNSFTISSLSGAMFLSEAYELIQLVEAMVHEYYHNELWVAMRVEPHLADSGEENLYSPWREDARPLTGLYHGTYVFTGLMEFFAVAQKEPSLVEHRPHFEAMRRKCYYQVRTALAQFPLDDLEPRGLEYVEKLREIAEEHGREIRASGEGIPEVQLQHWERWSKRYPGLSGTATPPTAVKDRTMAV